MNNGYVVLNSSHYLAKIALRDMVCYYIVKVDDDGTYKHASHIDGIISNEVITGKECLVDTECIKCERDFVFGKRITRVWSGVIRSYCTFEEPKVVVEAMKKLKKEDVTYEIYRCVIPMGTRYFTSCISPVYASKKIKFIEKVG